MKNTYIENELDGETLQLLNEVAGGYRQANRINDDFGDTSWIDEWMEDYLQG